MIPHYLYHYTSVENLIKILDSGNIRFTRLDKLNDPYEGYVEIEGIQDVGNKQAQLIYCSCWNDCEEENIALWYIYTKVRGVRIKAKAALFGEKWFLEEHNSGYMPVTVIDEIDIGGGTKINAIKGPIRIAYESDVKELYGQAVSRSIVNKEESIEFVMHGIDLEELGNRKMRHWSYENEWRFKIHPFKAMHGSSFVIGKNIQFHMPEYIDIPFISDIIEIMLSPQISAQDERKLRQYLKIKNLDIPVVSSKIKIKL